jgi:hypothetical protein
VLYTHFIIAQSHDPPDTFSTRPLTPFSGMYSLYSTLIYVCFFVPRTLFVYAMSIYAM